MKKNDLKYRQGRSKKQVENNDKVAFASILFFIVVLGVTMIVALISS